MSSQTSPTPGPWRLGRVGSVVSDHPVQGMSGSDAVEYYGGHLICESVTESNARLIVEAVLITRDFISWYEDAGSLCYSDDEGLYRFYREACLATGTPAKWGWKARGQIFHLPAQDGGTS